MVTVVNLTISIEGDKPFNTFSYFVLSQNIDWHHTFELKIPLTSSDNAGSTLLTKSKAFVGKSITFEFISSDNNKQLSQFSGVITELYVHRDGGITGDLVVKGFSPTIILDHGINTRYFSDKTLSAIVTDATSKYPKKGINYTIKPNPNAKSDFTLQYQESTYNFLNRLANRHGQWFFFNGKDCVFGSLPNSPNIDLKLGSDLKDFQVGVRLTPSKFKTKAYDYVSNKALESGPAQLSDLDDLGKFALHQSESYFFEEQTRHTGLVVKSTGDVNDIAKSKRSSIAANMVLLSGSSHNAQLKLGSAVSIKMDATEANPKSEDYGSFTVIKLTHHLDGTGNYSNTFEAIPHKVQVPPPNRKFFEPSCETQAAKVYKVDDPDGHGRVKVKFYWQEDSEGSTPWIRVMTAHAGKNRGVYFTPEVGDEVLVGFENNNPDRPMVIGSLYHGKADHSDRSDKDNYVKTIRTTSGNEIKFTDKKGEEEIHIMNKNGDNQIILNLKNNGKITIQSKGKIELKAQEINIEAEKDVTIKGKNIKQEATEKVGVKAKQAIEMHSTDIKATADAGIDMEAKAKLTLKAQAGLSMDGGATAELKANGSMAVSSSGPTTIKGAFVAIN